MQGKIFSKTWHTGVLFVVIELRYNRNQREKARMPFFQEKAAWWRWLRSSDENRQTDRDPVSVTAEGYGDGAWTGGAVWSFQADDKPWYWGSVQSRNPDCDKTGDGRRNLYYEGLQNRKNLADKRGDAGYSGRTTRAWQCKRHKPLRPADGKTLRRRIQPAFRRHAYIDRSDRLAERFPSPEDRTAARCDPLRT